MNDSTEISIVAKISRQQETVLLTLRQGGETLRNKRVPLDDDAVTQCVIGWGCKLPGLATDVDVLVATALATVHDAQTRAAQKADDTPLIDHALAMLGNARFLKCRDTAYVNLLVDVSAVAGGQPQGRQTLRIRSAQFEGLLISGLYKRLNRTAKRTQLNEVIDTLNARALSDGEEVRVFQRVGWDERQIVIDLGTADGARVVVTADGFSVVDNTAHYFERPSGMLPLPVPEPQGDIDRIWDFIHIRSRDAQILVASAIIGCFMPHGPYPLLIINGAEGSGKSLASRYISRLIDPHAHELIAFPSKEDDLVVVAHHRYLLAFDNLSVITPALADALCRLATGGSFSKRQLFSNFEKVSVEVCRPVLINGIGDLTDRADLLDRSIVVHPPEIDPKDRKTKRHMDQKFEEAAPGIFAAILSALSAALRNQDRVIRYPLGRMADFMAFVSGACEALPWTEDEFFEAFRYAAIDQQLEPVANDEFCMAVVAFARQRGDWEGNATELLRVLLQHCRGDDLVRRCLPTTASDVSRRLKRKLKGLRLLGVQIEFLPRTAEARGIRLAFTPSSVSLPSLPPVDAA